MILNSGTKSWHPRPQGIVGKMEKDKIFLFCFCCLCFLFENLFVSPHFLGVSISVGVSNKRVLRVGDGTVEWGDGKQVAMNHCYVLFRVNQPSIVNVNPLLSSMCTCERAREPPPEGVCVCPLTYITILHTRSVDILFR